MPGAGTNWHMAAAAPSGPRTTVEQQAGVPGVEHPPEHHGEAALVLALAAEAHQGGELVGERRVEVAGIVEGGGVAVLVDPVVGLAQSLHVPPARVKDCTRTTASSPR